MPSTAPHTPSALQYTGLQRAGHGDRRGVLPVALVPVLELAGAVAGVLADLEHRRDEHLDLDGLGDARRRHRGARRCKHDHGRKRTPAGATGRRAPTKAYSPIVTPQTTTTARAERGTALDDRRQQRVPGRLMCGPRIEVVGGSGSGAEEHVVTDRDTVEDHHLVLDMTPSPSTAPPSTYAPSQMLQSRPIRGPRKGHGRLAQTRVPDPTVSLSHSPRHAQTPPCSRAPTAPPHPAAWCPTLAAR